MDSVKLQELLDDPKNVFMIVTTVADKDHSVSKLSEATFQKVAIAIAECDRHRPDPRMYSGFRGLYPGIIFEGSPLFVISAFSYEGPNGYRIINTQPEIPEEDRSKLILMSSTMLAIKEGGIHLVRSKVYPTNIRVEV